MTKDERARHLEIMLTRELLRRDSTISDGALDYLVTAAKDTIEYQSALNGDPVRADELAEAAAKTDVGLMVFAEKNPEEEAIPSMEGWSSAKKMSWARANGKG